jgi:radical SAM protein with 4Fe4S-binding SPASM domain
MIAEKVRHRLSFYSRHIRQPRKLVHYTLLDVARVLRTSKVTPLPAMLDIEPTNYCNFRCPHCQVTHWTKPRVTLDGSNLMKVLDQFPNLLRVKLQGMGEPLLNKELLPMLEAIEARGIETEIVTNGSVMTDAICDKLLNLNTEVYFSVDGATQEVFESIRVGSSFKKVIDNIRKISEQRTNKKQKLAARTVVTKHNAHELADLVRLVAELKLDSLTLQLVLTSWGKAAMEERNAPKRVEIAANFNEELAKAKAEAQRYALPLEITTEDKYTRQRKCRWPWKSAYIASNGDVVPCCILADSDTVKMGNVFEEDFATIWNSEKYQELRQQIKDHTLADYCKRCYADA